MCIIFITTCCARGFGQVAEPQKFMAYALYGSRSNECGILVVFSKFEKISSSAAVTLSLAEPLTAALLGVFLIGEYLSATSWVGVALLLGGIIVLTFGSRRAT